MRFGLRAHRSDWSLILCVFIIETSWRSCQSLLLNSDNDVDSSGDFVDELGRAYSRRNKPIGIQKILSARAASMMIRTNYFFKLGGFDENFFASFEDVDIGWRSWIQGLQVVINPKSIVYHLGHQTIKNISPTIQFHSVKNTLILRLTNFEFYYSLKSIMGLFFVIIP